MHTECVQAFSPQEQLRHCQVLERDPREEIQLLYKWCCFTATAKFSYPFNWRGIGLCSRGAWTLCLGLVWLLRKVMQAAIIHKYLRECCFSALSLWRTFRSEYPKFFLFVWILLSCWASPAPWLLWSSRAAESAHCFSTALTFPTGAHVLPKPQFIPAPSQQRVLFQWQCWNMCWSILKKKKRHWKNKPTLIAVFVVGLPLQQN